MIENLIVVPVWDLEEQSDYTMTFVNQCLGMTLGDYHLVVVDNGSTSETTRRFLQTIKHRRLSVLTLSENIGYGKGCNAGVEFGLVHNPTYITVMNNDIYIKQSDWLEEGLVRWLREDTRRLVGTRYIDFNEGTRYGNEVVPYLEGWCLSFHKSFIQDVGLFDPEIFNWHEDVDLCIRAVKAGYTLFQSPAFQWKEMNPMGSGPIIHAYGRTGFQRLNFNAISEASKQRVIQKHGFVKG